MKHSIRCGGVILWMRVAFALALCCPAAQETAACTIFLLTDTNGVLFCNNDMPKIREQIAQAALQPLLINMKRFFLDAFPPIADPEPKVTAHLHAAVEDARRGGMRPADYSAEYWKEISPFQKDVQADFKRYGELSSMALVERRNEERGHSYRYRVEFENVTLLLRYVLSDQNQITLMQPEGAERKPGADLGGD